MRCTLNFTSEVEHNASLHQLSVSISKNSILQKFSAIARFPKDYKIRRMTNLVPNAIRAEVLEALRKINMSEMDLEKVFNLSHRLVQDSNRSSRKDKLSYYCGGVLEELVSVYANKYHPYLAGFVCVLGTISNICNVIVLTRREMSSAPINRILTALAIADIFLMVEYIPFACYYHLELMGKRDFPYVGAVYMLFHIHVAQILHTISICLTLTLAIWRYLAIGYPNKSYILCSESRCTFAISLSYILPIILCIPTYVTLKITSTEVYEDKVYILYHTTLSDAFQKDNTLLKINFWIYAVFIKLLPCCILTLITLWLIKTLCRAKKRKQILRGYDTYILSESGLPLKKKATKAERRAERTTKMLIAVLMLFLITEFPQGIFALMIGLRGKHMFLECYQKYGDVMDILALTNGSINFLLYCCMNRMFRATCGRLLKHKVLSKWYPPLNSEVHTTVQQNDSNVTEI